MKIKNNETGQIKEVTQEQWDGMITRGHAVKYSIVKEKTKAPLTAPIEAKQPIKTPTAQPDEK
jgi:hypothetical protein